MGGYTKDQMWNSVERMSKISHSTASEIQRTVKRARETQKTAAMGNLDPVNELEIKLLIEDDAGKLIDSDC